MRTLHIIVFELISVVVGLWFYFFLHDTYHLSGPVSFLLTLVFGIVFFILHNWLGKVTGWWESMTAEALFFWLYW